LLALPVPVPVVATARAVWGLRPGHPGRILS
jgi:hypothetical protein